MADFEEYFEKVMKEAQEEHRINYLEKNQQFKICGRYPDIKITVAYSLFHTALRDSLLGLKLHDFDEWIQNFDLSDLLLGFKLSDLGELIQNFDDSEYFDKLAAGCIIMKIKDIFQPDLWRLQDFSLTHAFLSIFMAFEAYLLKIASGMTADLIRLTDTTTDKRMIGFLDYVFIYRRKFDIRGYFDYFNKIFGLDLIGKNNSQWKKLKDFVGMRNSIVHNGGIKNIRDQISMVKHTGEQGNRPPEAYKITKKDIEELRELTIVFADQIELFFWEKMKDFGHNELIEETKKDK